MRPVRHHLGITAFGVNAFTGREAGDRIINEHDEADAGGGDEELYLVLNGRARFELDGDVVDAPAGSLVFAGPAVKRTAFAEEPETTLIAVGATPGHPYVPRGWEVWAPLNPLYREGKYAEVSDRGRELVEAHPNYPLVFYNLACCESLAGRKEDAIEHLRRGIELSEQVREFAKGDPDFGPIRDEPAFKQLVGT